MPNAGVARALSADLPQGSSLAKYHFPRSVAVLLLDPELPFQLPGGEAASRMIDLAAELDVWLSEEDFTPVDVLIVPDGPTTPRSRELVAAAAQQAKFSVFSCAFAFCLCAK